jgi:transcriptional regulator with XRE-family HTH domain
MDLQMLLNELGWTQAQLAKKARLSQGEISKLLAGRKLSAGVSHKIAKATARTALITKRGEVVFE